jgi:cytochrome b
MRSTLVYDLPIRLFHWLFSALFLTSFIIAKTTDDESAIFTYHMLTGALLFGLVLWRLIWGIIGSSNSRFSGFKLNPIDLKNYFWGIITRSKNRWTGKNPASSWASIAMFALTFGLAATGYLMISGGNEVFEDIHELFANAFVIIVIFHISGVLLHSIRHNDAIALSMIDGKKECPEESKSISSSRPFSAIVLFALVLSSGLYLYKNFDPQRQTLYIFGQILQLSENKGPDHDGQKKHLRESSLEDIDE